MKRFSILLVSCILLFSCSGNDDNNSQVNEPINTSNLLGKWVITKAYYIGDSDTIYYDYDGQCGREILEFTSDKKVSESLYMDTDCKNGGMTYYTWWTSNNTIYLGNVNSFKHTVTINGNKLLVDASAEGAFKKYYDKLN